MLDLKNPIDTYTDQRLRHETIIWFSTTGPNGHPHIIPVWFHWDGSTILVFRPPKNQVIRNLYYNSSVMLALNLQLQEDDIIMLEGHAKLLTDGTLATMVPTYVEKYAPLLRRAGLNAEIMANGYSQAIRITPTRIIGCVRVALSTV